MAEHRVVIVGGGFGGLHTARALKRAPVRVTLIDRRNYHLFQPLLYQVATGGLSPANIASPLRGILHRQKNCEVILGEVRAFDAAARLVHLRDGQIAYDTLVVATGGLYNYFGHDEWQSLAPGLKSLEDAVEIRQRVLMAFEAAERESDPDRRRAWLTFVIIGAGPTGVELAGALSELARHTLKHDFRHIVPSEARIVLIDAADRVLGVYPEKLCRRAEADLQDLGVTVRTKTFADEVCADHIVVRRGDVREKIPARTVVWAAGIKASPLGTALAEATGAETDRMGRVIVNADLSVGNDPYVFVIGDLAHTKGRDGNPLPGLAPVAIQQGQYVARLIKDRLRGREPKPFVYKDRGSMATIGRSRAIADLNGWKFTGFTAWLVWLFIHLMLLVGFRNRVLVFFQWAWSYLTFDRSARLITGTTLDLNEIPSDKHPTQSPACEPAPENIG